ncbi:hypothetical protein HYW18_00560 [Candidatus Uhrbacteria bacterium]|nr:hypothetical protein [Candidatus Uhrbacteria bacterium]
MDSTKLLYLEHSDVLENTAKVVSVEKDGERDVIVLEATIFYPQGGGQPYDQGVMQSNGATFLVEEVRFVDGIVRHIGKFEHGTFAAGQEVACTVQKDRRQLHSRLHSAGHVVDLGVTSLGLKWIPGKGYHFPDGPYVEYAGDVENADKEKLKADLEAVCNKVIAEDRKTTLQFMEKDKLHEVCHFVPDYIPEGKPTRVVFYGDFAVPCGGTHVGRLSEIGHMAIRKIKTKGGNIQVAYDVDR